MSLIIDATKAAERERERRQGKDAAAAPLLVPLRSQPAPAFSWRRALLLGGVGAVVLGGAAVAFVQVSNARQQPTAFVSPPLIADVGVAPVATDSVVTLRDSAPPPVASAPAKPASRPRPTPSRQPAVVSAVANADAAGAAADTAAATQQAGAPAEPQGRLRIAVDSRELTLSQIFAMGVAAHRAGEVTEARGAYERVLAMDPNHADALNNMGVLLSASREFDRAETLLRRAVRLSPENAAAWNNLGTALAQRGQSGDAIAAFQRALAIEPQHVSARVSLAQQYLAIGSTKDARALLDAVLSSDPSVAEAHYAMGQLRELEQDWAGAIQSYQAFTRTAPARLAAHVDFVRRRVDALSARVR